MMIRAASFGLLGQVAWSSDSCPQYTCNHYNEIDVAEYDTNLQSCKLKDLYESEFGRVPNCARPMVLIVVDAPSFNVKTADGEEEYATILEQLDFFKGKLDEQSIISAWAAGLSADKKRASNTEGFCYRNLHEKFAVNNITPALEALRAPDLPLGKGGFSGDTHSGQREGAFYAAVVAEWNKADDLSFFDGFNLRVNLMITKKEVHSQTTGDNQKIVFPEYGGCNPTTHVALRNSHPVTAEAECSANQYPCEGLDYEKFTDVTVVIGHDPKTSSWARVGCEFGYPNKVTIFADKAEDVGDLLTRNFHTATFFRPCDIPSTTVAPSTIPETETTAIVVVPVIPSTTVGGDDTTEAVPTTTEGAETTEETEEPIQMPKTTTPGAAGMSGGEKGAIAGATAGGAGALAAAGYAAYKYLPKFRKPDSASFQPDNNVDDHRTSLEREQPDSIDGFMFS